MLGLLQERNIKCARNILLPPKLHECTFHVLHLLISHGSPTMTAGIDETGLNSGQ